jgi:hypothetical protein
VAWSHDSEKVQSQISEFHDFLNHARNDNPAGIGDLLGRPFYHPTEPPVQLQPQPVVEPNYYLLQTGHLYEAGLINQQQFNTIVNNIYR